MSETPKKPDARRRHAKPGGPKPAKPGGPRQAKPARQPLPADLAALFKRCGIQLSDRQIGLFWTYHGLLRRHNADLNLTRIHNFDNMVLKLYVDSALPARLAELPTPLLDLGSGPGMPGIPLKIMRPDLTILLAEGRGNRTAFLGEALAELNLEGISVIERNITPEFTQPVAGVITRAVESMALTAQRVSGCLRQGGSLIFMKGPACDAEIEEMRQDFGDRYELVRDEAYRIGATPHQRRLVIFRRLDAPAAVLAEEAARRLAVTAVASDRNSRFKELRKLLTSRGIRKAGRALMSGSRQVGDMLDLHPERCLAWVSSGPRQPPPAAAPPHMEWLQLSPDLFQALDVFGTHHPLLAIEVPPPSPWDPAEGFPPGCSLLLPFQDPENVGAAIRSAAAFGVSQVILLSEAAHPYHPKALRASGGTVPAVRLRQGPPLAGLPPGLPLIALSPQGRDLAEIDFPPAFGLLIGLEGPGLPADLRAPAVGIPIRPEVESLNAAAAAAVALYEWSRRGRTGGRR